MAGSQRETAESPSEHRVHVVQALELLASRERQLALQSMAPEACACSEMFYQWNHWYGGGPADWDRWSGQGAAEAPFSREELMALAEFNLVFEEVDLAMPVDRPRLDEFLGTPQWRQLTHAAGLALAALVSGA